MRSHTIPGGPSTADKPRAPGEYVISNQNGVGIDIAKVTKLAGKRLLTTVRQLGTIDLAATIQNNEVHDTFIQNDPLDGRTYLYNAAGFATGFNVYDITDPSRVKQVAEWDLTPQCEQDWYAHTIDVTHQRRPPLRDDARRDAAAARLGLAERHGRDVRRRQGRGLRLLRRQRRQARPAVDRRRDGLLEARPGERQEVARAGVRDRHRAAQGLRGRARRDLDEPRRARRRIADVLAAQPADRRRQDLPLALPRRRLRARRLGRVLRQARAPEGARLHRAARQADPAAARPAAADRPARALLHGLPARPPRGLGHGRLQGPRPRRGHDRRLLLAALRRQPAAAVRRQAQADVGLQPQELEPAGQADLPARQRLRQGLQRRARRRPSAPAPCSA